MFVWISYRQNQKRLCCRRNSFNSVRIFSGNKNCIAGLNALVNAVHVDQPLALNHVQNMLAGVDVQREGAARLHLDQVCADFRAIHSRGRHPCSPPNTGQRSACFIAQRHPVARQNVANIFA